MVWTSRCKIPWYGKFALNGVLGALHLFSQYIQNLRCFSSECGEKPFCILARMQFDRVLLWFELSASARFGHIVFFLGFYGQTVFNSLSSWVFYFSLPSEGSSTYLCGIIKPQTTPGTPRSDVQKRPMLPTLRAWSALFGFQNYSVSSVLWLHNKNWTEQGIDSPNAFLCPNWLQSKRNCSSEVICQLSFITSSVALKWKAPFGTDSLMQSLSWLLKLHFKNVSTSCNMFCSFKCLI